MTLQKVKVAGDFFVNADGSEFHYIGASEFGDLKRAGMGNGLEALVRPNLIQRKLIRDRAGYKGPIVNRVFRVSDPGNPFGQLPGAVQFDLINKFLDLCAEYNVYVDFTQGDDDHGMLFGPQLTGLQEFHNKFTSSIQRFCFYETENEPFKNGSAPQNGIVPPVSEWYLRDSGNYVFINDTTHWETQYDLDFISFHPDRTNHPSRWPKWVCDLDDSISVLRSVVGKPPVLKEVAKFGVHYTDPSYARQLGLRASMGGVGFHSQLGLESNGFDDATKDAYFNFFRGVAGSLNG
jgi:hypothetical protein